MIKKYPVGHYYEAGRYPVAEFVRAELDDNQRTRLQAYVELLEDQGPHLTRPYCEKLKGYTDLWELRPSFWRTEIRIIYTWYKNRPVFLEGFIEKSEGKKTERYYKRADERKQKLFSQPKGGINEKT